MAKTDTSLETNVIVCECVSIVAGRTHLHRMRGADTVPANNLSVAHSGGGLEGEAHANTARAWACLAVAIIARRAVQLDGVCALPCSKHTDTSVVTRVQGLACNIPAEVHTRANAVLTNIVDSLWVEVVARCEVRPGRGRAPSSVEVTGSRLVALGNGGADDALAEVCALAHASDALVSHGPEIAVVADCAVSLELTLGADAMRAHSRLVALRHGLARDAETVVCSTASAVWKADIIVSESVPIITGCVRLLKSVGTQAVSADAFKPARGRGRADNLVLDAQIDTSADAGNADVVVGQRVAVVTGRAICYHGVRAHALGACACNVTLAKRGACDAETFVNADADAVLTSVIARGVVLIVTRRAVWLEGVGADATLARADIVTL